MSTPDTSTQDFDFETALEEALGRIDKGPHCSCADITMEVLRAALGLQCPVTRHAASAFGGGVGGNGAQCGAFSAGLIAMAIAYAEREEPEGCIADPIGGDVCDYYDAWMEEHGSVLCSELSGYPCLREEAVRQEFFDTGGPERCTSRYIRFAVHKILELTGASRPAA